eukprot:362115-Pyramimonas_sp.AAC.1
MRMNAALASVDQETGAPRQHVITAAVNKVVESLRGDAFDIAMDIGKDVLLIPNGIDQLVLAIRTSLAPPHRGAGSKGPVPGGAETIWTT